MKPKLTTFPNGLRLLVVPEVAAATATVLVLVGTGSKYETKSENGISHFLEHLYFKGTTKLPTSRDITERFDRIGAICNAFTSTEYTGYYAKGAPKHIPTFIKILSDIYLNSTFPEAEITKEKGVVIEEINMYDDMPQHKAEEFLMRLMYGDQPAGWPISGSRENVRGFTRDDVVRYQHTHYHATNTVVVVSGAVEPTVVKKMIKEYFGTISTNKDTRKKSVAIARNGLQHTVMYKAIDQAHLCIGFHSVPIAHKDTAVVTLLATILGRGMSSRLFQSLREDLGLAYYVSASHDPYTDHGLFEIMAGIDKDKVALTLDTIATILNDMKATLVSDAELSKAQEYTLGTARLGLESSDEIAGFYGIQLLLKGSYKTLADLTREYKQVTPADIRRVARTIFTRANTSVAMVGPTTLDDSAFASW